VDTPAVTVLLCGLALLAAAGGQEPLDKNRDLTGAGFAFVELATARATCYADELVPLTIVVGVEERFLREQAVQLFRQTLDVPVQLAADWLDGVACVEAGSARPALATANAPTVSLAYGGRVLRAARAAPRVVDGRTFTVLELDFELVPTCVGALVLDAPSVRLAYTSEFRSDPLAGRVPIDRIDGAVRGAPLRLAVLPLPEANRPAGFGGAIGRFTVRAEAEPRSVRVGGSLRLSLVVEGTGNLARVGAPRLPPLAGFRSFGAVGDGRAVDADGFVYTYDVSPTGTSVEALPAFPFSFFDPASGEYRTVVTSPLPVSVRPASPVSSGPSAPSGSNAATATDDEPAPEPVGRVAPEPSESAPVWVIVLGALVGSCLAACWVLRSRATDRSPGR
jgi:cell division septation protein DedD